METVEFGFTSKQILEEGRTTRQEIEELRSWLATQNLPKLTDEQIIIFLLSCCNSQEATQKRIVGCYHLAKVAPELSTNRNVEREDLQKQLNVGQCFVIPERTEGDSVIIFMRLCDTNYKNLDMKGLMILMSMTMNAAFFDYPPNDMIAVCDMKGIGFMHLTRLNLQLTKIFFKFLQEGLPLNMKEIHMLNTIAFLDKGLLIVRPFINDKIFNMVHFHPTGMDMDSFSEKWIPKRCLPNDYGGDLPHSNILHEKHVEKLKKMRPHFEAEERQRSRVFS